MNTVIEKMNTYGVETLSNAELFSVLTNGEIQEDLGFSVAGRKTAEEFAYEGISKESSEKLVVAMEIGRRYEQFTDNKAIITSPEDAFAFIRPLLRDRTTERFYIILLDNAKHVIGSRLISKGGSTATIVDPAEVMRKAITGNAVSMVLAHNHPSGVLKASSADIKLTKRLSEAGRMLGIPVEDHIIIAGSSYVSFRNKGMM